MLTEFVAPDTAHSLLMEDLPNSPQPLPDTSEQWSGMAPVPVQLLPTESFPSSDDDRSLASLVSTEFDAWSGSGDRTPTATSSDPLLEWNTAPIWQTTRQTLSDFLLSPDSDASMALAFGETGATFAPRSFVQQLIDGKILPTLSVLPEATLAAQGAYAAKTDTIFLAKELFGQPEKLLRVFLEELGHFIDNKLNAVDSPGDEGAIFAAQVIGDELTEEAIAALKAEDDTATLTVGEQTLQIEQADLGPGTFTVEAGGQIAVEFLVDSGAYKGQLAVFSLDGMEGLALGSPEFIQEAARRALSNSEGYVVIDDIDEGASLTGELGERDRNSGEAPGVKGIAVPAGTHLAVMLVPDGTVAEVFDNPRAEGRQRPLFSLAAANPGGQVHIAEIRPGVFAMEDVRADANSDFDFNDVIFRLQGAIAQIEPINNVAGSQQIWINTPLGQQLFLLPDDALIPPDSPTSDTPIFIGSDNPVFPPIDEANLQVSIPDGVAKFDADDSEAAIAASGAARITFGTQTVYIGTNQVSSINQNPIVASFDSANPANNWIRTDYEVTGADGRGIGIAWDGNSLYAVFTVDGTQGSPSEDFRRAANDAEQAWLRSYGAGGGAKVSVLGRIDPTTGELLDAAYLSAILSNGNSNTLTVEDLATNSSGNLVVSAQSFFSPRRPDGSALTQTTPGSSPFAYTVEISADLKRVISTAAPGWS